MAAERETGYAILTTTGLAFFGLIGLAFSLGQTTVMPWVDPEGYGPNLTLVVVLYLGLYAPLTLGSLTVVGLGYILDVSGGGVVGINAGLFLAAFYAAAGLHQKIDPTAPWYLALFILGFVVAIGGLTWVVLYLFDWPLPAFPNPASWSTVQFAVSAAATAIVGPILFWILDRFRLLATGLMEREQ